MNLNPLAGATFERFTHELPNHIAVISRAFLRMGQQIALSADAIAGLTQSVDKLTEQLVRANDHAGWGD